MAAHWVSMAQNELVAENWGGGSGSGLHRVGPGIHVLHRPGVYLAGTGCWEMGGI